MKIRLIIAVLASLFIAPSYAQYSKPILITQINTSFPDNTTGAITPATTRTFLNNLINSFQQYTGTNAQVGTSYTVLGTDYGQIVSMTNVNPITLTIPTPSGSFATFNTYIYNKGVGTITATSPSATINGAASLTIHTNQIYWFISDGTGANYIAIGIDTAATAAATANQIPVYPGGGAAVVPTSATTWFDAVCSSTIGRIWVRLSGGWGCTSLGYANPVWWGADPTGAADSAAAFVSALSASNSVIFPAGKFKLLSTVSYTFPPTVAGGLSIAGQGPEQTILYWPNATTGMNITLVTPQNSIHIHDVTYSTGTADAGTAVNLLQNSPLANFSMSSFDNVIFRGDPPSGYWTTAVITGAVSGINFNSVQIYGIGVGASALGTGIHCIGTGGLTGYSIMINVIGGMFNQLNNAIIYDSYCQGVTVSGGTNFTNDATAIYSPSSAAGTLTQLTMVGSEASLNHTNVVIQSALNYIYFSSNYFDCPSGQDCIAINTSINGVIVGNIFNCNAASPNGLNLKTTRFTVTGNIFDNCATGVSLLSPANHNNVQANIYNNNSVTTVNNTGTANSVGVATQ